MPLASRRIAGSALASMAAVCTALVSFASSSSAQSLGAASNYNAFVFGNFTESNTDIEGRLAVGGNLNVNNYGVGNQLNSATAGNSLVVGGSLTYGNGQVFNGNVVYGTSASYGASFNVAHGTISQGTPVNFASAQTQLLGLSSQLAGLATSGSFSNYYGTLQFVGTDANLNTFVVQATDFNAANGIKIDAPAGSTVVINIAGQVLDFDNMSINFVNLNGDATGATDRNHVLYNFFEAQTLAISGISVQGSILAPKAAVNFSNGNIEGTLIAASLTGSGEFHNYQFQGTLPVPEPSSIALFGLASASLLVLRRRAA